jgi:O-antigen/teichoic acid export membrane protein
MSEVISETQTSPPGDAHKASFFRQSGWLMIANIGGGVLMWAVHFLSKRITKGEYGDFVTFLGIVMCIPTMPLQMALAHQTAQAIARNRLRELAGMIRMVVGITFLFWVIAALGVFLWRASIVKHWGIANPVGLYVTLLVVLFSLWVPLFWGVLQGQQNFLWLGWSMISSGIGRLAVSAIAVIVLSASAAGMMTGVLLGMVFAAAIAIWQTRAYWTGPSSPFDSRELLREIGPPMLGFAAFQFLFTGDTLFVKTYFSNDDAGLYGSAGTLSRALMWLVGPLASVMFPRIVHSAAKSEKSNLMNLVLAGTAVLAVVGAASLSLLGPWIVRIVYPANYVPVATSVLPWYAGAMVPLTIANVLLNNLLARSAFKVVAPICILAAAYGFALTCFHDSLVMVLQTMGIFNLTLALICAWFTWTRVNKAKVAT